MLWISVAVFFNACFPFQIFLCEIVSFSSRRCIKMFETVENNFRFIRNIPKKAYAKFDQKLFWIQIVIVGFYINLVICPASGTINKWYPHWYFLADCSNLTHMCYLLYYVYLSFYIMRNNSISKCIRIHLWKCKCIYPDGHFVSILWKYIRQTERTK